MSGENQSAIYRFGRREIDLGRREMRLEGVRVPLGSRAFDIVEVLVQAKGALTTKDELARRVWRDRIVDDNTLQVHVSAVRKALGSDRLLLKTASGQGYRLLGDWTAEEGALEATQAYAGTAPDAGAAIVSPPFASRNNLPIAVTELVGREVAKQQIRDLMSSYRVVTLVGSGGIGKTRLSVAVAAEQLSDFPNGVWFIDLSPLSDADLVPSVIASVLGLNLGGSDLTPTRVAGAIGDKRFLVVLDNCEHVIEVAAQVAETIARICPAMHILATSREPLRIESETVYRVSSLTVPAKDQMRQAVLLQSSAVQLFVARARALQFDVEESPAALTTVAAICMRLDGIPLAIEMAAASAATLGLELTLRHLDQRFELLTGGRRTAPPRQRTLLATLDWSHGLLSETERVIFRRLGVFPDGFTLDTACLALATPDISSGEIIDGLATLIAKSLVAVDAAGATTRYFLLETMRAYALDKLAASGETNTAMRRYAQFLLGLLERGLAERAHRPLNEWGATYRCEIDNLRVTLDWAFSAHGDPALAVMLVTRSIGLMFDLSLISELNRRAEQALVLIKTGVQPDPRCEMYLLAALYATRVYTEGPSDASFEAWETVLRLATLHDEAEFKTRALWGLWNDNLYSGTPVVALSFAKRFADLATSLRDTTRVIIAHRLIGISLHYHGDQPAARAHLEQVLARYEPEVHRVQTLGARLNQATVTRATLVRVLWLQGEPDKALQLCQTAVTDAFAEDHLMSTLYVLVEAALPLSLVLADFEAAERFLAILLEQAVLSGFRIWHTYGLCFTAVLQVHRGNLDTGVPNLSAAIEELRATRFCVHLSMFLGVLAIGQANAGQVEKALITVNNALHRSEKHEDHWYSPELLRLKGEIALRQPSVAGYIESEALFRQAMAMAHRQGAQSWELRAATNLARLLRQNGQPTEAYATLAPRYERFREGFSTPDLTSARALLGEL